MDPALVGQVKAFITESQNSMLSNLEELMTRKLEVFEEKVSETQKDISDAQCFKLRQDILYSDSHKFVKKSCEEQFKFNTKVTAKLREAEQVVFKDPAKSHDLITEGIDLINYRQKLIKLADTSESGWKAVEYVANPIASDSEDEKKIERARRRADQKSKALKQKSASKGRGRYAPYQHPRPVLGYVAPTEQEKISPARTQRPGVCYGCGKAGHWRMECPAIVSAATASGQKISRIFYSKHVQSNCESSLLGISSVDFSQSDSSVSSPVGRLKAHVAHWKKNGTSGTVLSIIDEGYKMPFSQIPPSAHLANNKSSSDNADFVQAEIKKLIKLGCVSEVAYKPHVVNPLTVAFGKSGKPRLALDCRHVNLFLHRFKFKYEDATTARELFETGSFMFTFDLKSAYHHIGIFPLHRTYLGFQFVVNGKTRFFIFNVLPFGISTAGYIFTKVLREVVKHIRSVGHKLVMYLDDGIGGHISEGGAKVASNYVRSCLSEYGFILADDKCQWEPSQEVAWLGYTWSMAEGVVRVSTDRVNRLLFLLQHTMSLVSLKGQLLFSARYVARIVGLVISMQGVVGQIVRLRTREMYKCLLNRASWNSGIFLSSAALDEIEFWLTNIEALNEKGAKLTENKLCSLVVCTDASEHGFGGYVTPCVGSPMETEFIPSISLPKEDFYLPTVGSLYNAGNGVVFGSWGDTEKFRSSTWRELEAAKRVLHSSVDRVKDQQVKLLMDNKAACSIIRSGSSKTDLHNIALDVFNLAVSNKIDVVTQWLPREKNMTADFLSRCSDADDWSVQSWVFNICNTKWGAHEVDRFATDYNAKCIRFNSRWWCKGTEAVDAFTVKWEGVNNWLVPPPRLICQALSKMKAEQACGTLVLPVWRSAPFWPVLCPRGKFETWVVDSQMLFRTCVTMRGRGNNGCFGKSDLLFDMLALRLDCSK